VPHTAILGSCFSFGPSDSGSQRPATIPEFRVFKRETGDYLRTSLTRILLVEDFKPYRSLTATLLSHNPDLKVIGEAEDGSEAVAQAQQLRPDLILMDIGLPKLNGLEAARRMRDVLPSAKIVFLTQVADADVVKVAFNLGARGYIVKQQAETELLIAIAAVLSGKRFVTSGLSGDGFGVEKSAKD